MEKLRLENFISKYNFKTEGIYINDSVRNYTEKIFKNATILEYVEEAELKGFIAYYANDYHSKVGYLTMILVEKNFQGNGIGRMLLDFSIRDLINKGFIFYKLEVLKLNTKAISFYKRIGFLIEEDRGELYLMSLNLSKYD